MTDTVGFECRACGQHHAGLPFSYGTLAPAYWRDELAADGRTSLTEEQCTIDGGHFYVRARIVVPVRGPVTEFEWGVWVSLSESNFERMTRLWTTTGREREEPYFGWLSTEIPIYHPTTLNLATRVHTEPVGQRPTLELEPTDHPLAVEQRAGITLDRVQQIAELIMHAQD